MFVQGNWAVGVKAHDSWFFFVFLIWRVNRKSGWKPWVSQYSGDFSFAYVTDTGGGDETVLGTPISIRNDGYIGIGMLPENQILDVSGTNYVRSKSKILSVSGGADFINYNTDGTFSNTVTASVFENPGNPITYDEGLGIARDSGDYYGGSGTLYVKGSRYIDSDEGDEYDIVLTGNKHPYIKELAYETTGRYFGTRIDGKLHLYSQTEKIINISFWNI